MVSVNNIQPISHSQNFKANTTRLVSIERHPDYEARTYELEASTGKKWGVGLASFFVTGLGQAINGSWGKAAGFFFSSILLALISAFTVGRNKLIAAISGTGAIGISIWSIIDAVKNAKSETVQIIPRSPHGQSINHIA